MCGVDLEQSSRKKKILHGYLALAVGVLSLSLSPILVKTINAPKVVTTFYRMTITALVFSLAVPFRKGSASDETDGKRRSLFPLILLPVLAGTFSGLDYGFWAIALDKTSVSNTTVLNAMSPVWIAIFSLIFLREKFSGRFWIGLTLAMVGMVFMSGKGIDFFREGFNEGDRIAFLSSVFNGGYFLFTQVGRRHFSAIRQMWISNTFCALTLLVFCKIMGLPLTGYDRSAWIGFFTVAFLCQILGHFSFTYSLGILPASVVGPMDELRSVFSSLIAILVFKEYMTLNQVLGCAGIVIGVILINRGKIDEIRDDAPSGGEVPAA